MDPISLILGTRFSIVGTRIGSLKLLKKLGVSRKITIFRNHINHNLLVSLGSGSGNI